MSTIRKSLNKLTVLPSAARAVLIEVCELVENGGKGKCFAGNAHLAEKACCHIISVSKHLRLLKDAGLVLEQYENGNPAARMLSPSAEVVAAYSTGDLTTLSRVLGEAKQGARGTLSRVLADPKQGTNHTHIHKGDSEDTTLEYPNVALSTSARADQAKVSELEKKLSELETRLENAKAAYRAQQAELTAASLRADQAVTENAKLRTQLAKREKKQTLPARRPIPALPEWHPEQISTLPPEKQELLGRFHAWATNEGLEAVFGMERALTPNEVLRLTEKHGAAALKDILMQMEASKALVGKTSAYHSANNWIRGNERREAEREEQRQQQQQSRFHTNEPRAAYGAQGRYTGKIN